MTPALVSCIVPVFNGAQYLREAVDSILAQTHRPLEMIVVDDGSSDDTPTILASYGSQLRSLWQPNGGMTSARSRGIEAARGVFLSFLDADDRWHPEKLARQVSRFNARPELGACVTHVQNFWAAELRDEAQRFRHHRVAAPLPGYIAQALMVRRDVFERVGPFDPMWVHANELDWFLRAAERGILIELLPDVLTYRRIRRDSMSRLDGEASRDEHLLVIKRHLDRVRRQGKTAGAELAEFLRATRMGS